MTDKQILEIINEVYGYEIIDKDAYEKLRSMRDVIISELGIETIYEFLSYDITEYSEARKSIHVRRFYQIFKEVFRLEAFTIEAFHKIQAGCLHSALASGIIRGYGSYDYSGFVNDILLRVRTGGTGDAGMTPVDLLEEITGQFNQFSRISLGIYSLQIFTKYGICIEKVKSKSILGVGKIFMDAMDKAGKGMAPTDEFKKILDIRIPDEQKVSEVVEEYIDYAVNGVMGEGIPISRSRANKQLTESIKEVRKDAGKAFAGFVMEIDSIRGFREALMGKLPVYEKNTDDNDITILYFTMLEKYVFDLERLSYYEDIYYIKRFNSMFVDRVKDIFDAQMSEEQAEIQSKCAHIIEKNIEGYIVHDLDGVLNGLSKHRDRFKRQLSLEQDTMDKIIEELKEYLREQLEIVYDIRRNLKDNLVEILRPDLMYEESLGVLEDAIVNFADIRNFVLEEE